jgi:ACS family phthalate transporter-like MFS transporter
MVSLGILSQVGSGNAPLVLDREIEAAYRKVSLRLLPFLFLSWVVNYLDRVNLGFAKIPFTQDLGMSDAAYGIGVGIFSIGYVLLEVPSNLLLEKIGARKTMARIMILWGVISCSMMFVQSTTEFYVTRVLLGAAEAGFYPGVLLYLTYWFPSARRARVTSRFMLALAVSGMVGGPVAGWILHTFSDIGGLRNWQWLFLLEGVPAILLGVIAYFYLTDRPQEAAWLDDSEKRIIIGNLAADEALKEKQQSTRFLDIVRDPRVYIIVLAYLVNPMLGIVLNYWTPTIIHQAGVNDILFVSVLSSIPFVAGALGMLVIAHHSDRTQERRWHFLGSVALGSLGLIMLPTVSNHPTLAIGCLSLLGIAYFSAGTIFWTIPPTYFAAAAAAGGIALTSSVGQAGSLFTPVLLGWLQTQTSSIALGLYAIAAITIAGGSLIVLGVPKAALRGSDGRSR